MYNLHTHSLLSDGVLLPSEIAARYIHAGYKAVAITDHVDYCNIDACIRGLLNFCRHWPKNAALKILPGVELTHLPLEHFKPLAKYARKAGIKVIIGHGETPAEPVIRGTNRAALEADIDILAHPGLITDKDVRFAGSRGIFLEITSRHGHSRTNSFVAKQALKFGAKLVLNHDSHAPKDIISPAQTVNIGRKSGLTLAQIDRIYRDTACLLKAKLKGK
ncbi:MAG: histidinol phosphate phosphatase domain-containing protein [Candidatus Omnitrophica bacterium]|nr:histidinol phosphate phosphatase domain-containing protein [Candidatus Omnitrophota bacterium]